MALSKAALLSLAASRATAFVLLPAWPLSVQRLDPIVVPDGIATHVHQIVGGSAFAPNMTYASTQLSKCTTATVSVDFSNYWVPQLYHKNSDNSFDLVPALGSMSLYYLNEPYRLGGDKVMEAFPSDLRMLAGYPDGSDKETLPEGALNFKCLNYNGKPTDSKTLPDYDCPNGLRAEITFPSCWNGSSDSTDHRSHMAYPEGGFEGGPCPKTHPRHLVVLKSELIFDTTKFPVNGKNPFVFSNGDLDGSRYHADFFNGWQDGLLQRVVDECSSPTGLPQECAPLLPYLPAQQVFLDPGNCKVESFVEEEVEGRLDKLPGCNALTSGSGLTKRNNCGDNVQLKQGWQDSKAAFGGNIKAAIKSDSPAFGGISSGSDSHAADKPAACPAPAAPANHCSKKIVTEWNHVTKTVTASGSAPTPGKDPWLDAKRDVVEHVHRHRSAHRRRGSL